MTPDLRARITRALEECRVLTPEAQADAVMAVLEPGLAARGAALRALMNAADKLVFDWPNPGSPKNRQAVTRAIDEAEVLFRDVITAHAPQKAALGPADYSPAGISTWYGEQCFKCASCGTPDSVKPLTFRLPNGGGDLCAECARPVIESTRAIEELIARKKAREAGGEA